MSQEKITCRAYKYRKRGDPADVLVLDERHVVPKPGKKEVLIKVAAVALNPVDWKMMKYMPFGARSPVAACDYSGTIVKSNVSHFQPGDEVYGLIHMPFKIWRGMGSLAEYVVAPADTCAKRPPHVPQADAAGLTLVGVTALAMSGEIDFKKHEKPRVLVCGGSSAVGLMLIPILRQKGCSVTATCSEPKADVVKKRGADAVINYRSSNFQQHLKDEAANNGLFDYILDCVDSFDVWNVSPHILRGTSYISVGFDASQGLLPAVRRIMSYLLLPGWLGGVSTRYRRPSDPATQERMSELAKLVDEGVLTPVIDSQYGFDEVKQAFRRLQTNRANGKVVIRVQ